MNIMRVVPNINTSRMADSISFYTNLIGFEVAMDMDWIVTLKSPSNPSAQISLLKTQSPESENGSATITIEVEDIDTIYEKVVSSGVELLLELTTESWGVRRFHVRDPNGMILNIMHHVEQNW